MEYTVTIKPTGHTFTTHENEPILESGLRAGHNLKYQCDNGTCGECKARLLSGEVNILQTTDFRFTEVEKKQGYFLPCTCEAKSDLWIEAGEFSSAADVPYQEILTRVTKVDYASDDIILLQLRTPRTNTLRFLAGQSALIELPDKSNRTLQIASCPCNGMVLEFHIRRRADDAFSDYLFERLNINYEITIKGPSGEFILDEETERPLLFIAYDTGFSAVKSLIEHAISLEMEQDMHLYRIACNPEEDYMHNVCRAWADAIDNLYYHALEHCIPMDCDDNKKAKACSQFLSILDKGDGALIVNSDVYLSGVEGVVANFGKALIGNGLPEYRLKVQQVY